MCSGQNIWLLLDGLEVYSSSSMPLPFAECPRSRSRLCCNERLASALTLPPNGREGRTPLDEKDGVSVVHSKSVRFQTFRPFTSLALNSYTTHSSQYVCMLVQGANERKGNDRELCITFWYKKMSKYNGSLQREGHSM